MTSARRRSPPTPRWFAGAISKPRPTSSACRRSSASRASPRPSRRLLSKASFRAPDTVFDDDLTLDLGGVRVRLSGVGPNHTRGDTVMYVEEDRVLFTGDVVMPVFPAASAQAASIEKWLANIAAFEAFAPRVVVPAHGRLIDAAQLAPLSRVSDRRADANTRRETPRPVRRSRASRARAGAGAAIQRSRAAGRRAGDGPHQRRDPSGLSRRAVSAEPQ